MCRPRKCAIHEAPACPAAVPQGTPEGPTLSHPARPVQTALRLAGRAGGRRGRQVGADATGGGAKGL